MPHVAEKFPEIHLSHGDISPITKIYCSEFFSESTIIYSTTSFEFLSQLKIHNPHCRDVDLRSILGHEPSVIRRDTAILLSFDDFHAIITPQKLFLLSTHQKNLSGFTDFLKDAFDSSDFNDSEFQVRALHASLCCVTAIFQLCHSTLFAKIESILRDLKSSKKITAELKAALRLHKNSTRNKITNIESCQHLIRDFADLKLQLGGFHPEHLQRVDLITPQARRAPAEMKTIARSFLADLGTMKTKLTIQDAQLYNTEEYISFRINMAQNRLLMVDITLVIVGAAVVSVGNFPTSITSMNMESGLYGDSSWTLSSVCVVVIAVVSVVILVRVYSMQSLIKAGL